MCRCLLFSVTIAVCSAEWHQLQFAPLSEAQASSLTGGQFTWCTVCGAWLTCDECQVNVQGGSNNCTQTSQGTDFESWNQAGSMCTACNPGNPANCSGNAVTYQDDGCMFATFVDINGCTRTYDPNAVDQIGPAGSTCPNNCPGGGGGGQ